MSRMLSPFKIKVISIFYSIHSLKGHVRILSCLLYVLRWSDNKYIGLSVPHLPLFIRKSTRTLRQTIFLPELRHREAVCPQQPGKTLCGREKKVHVSGNGCEQRENRNRNEEGEMGKGSERGVLIQAEGKQFHRQNVWNDVFTALNPFQKHLQHES